jgi:xanthine/uracil permease
MDKILKPFIVFITYCALYSATFVTACALIALTFWVNYLEVAQHPVTIGIFLMTIGCHLTLTLSKSDL